MKDLISAIDHDCSEELQPIISTEWEMKQFSVPYISTSLLASETCQQLRDFQNISGELKHTGINLIPI